MIRVAAVAFLIGVARPALAAGGEHGGAGDLLFPALNLALLIAVLVYFARKPIQRFFAQRREQVRGDLKSAAELLSQAERRSAKWQRRLMDLEGELEGIRAAVRERAEAERERILSDAAAAAERIRRDAAAAIEQELRRARAELREQASDLAVELAGELLREQVTDADRGRLIDEFIERIERDGRADGSGGNSGRGPGR